MNAHKHAATPKMLPTNPKAALGTFFFFKTAFKKCLREAELSSSERHSLPSVVEGLRNMTK